MICIDANLAVKLVFDEEPYHQARALFRACAERGERIVASPLLPIEVTNIIRQRMRRAKPPREQLLSHSEAKAALERFLTFPVELIMPPELHQHALELAITYELPAVYDAHFVALAQLLGCLLWTDDQRLLRAVGGKLSFVRWIGDYTQEQEPP